MADNSVATQVQAPQPQNLLQTAMTLQKVKQAFPSNSAMANPVKATAFEPDND
jgi:hypothetical protein